MNRLQLLSAAVLKRGQCYAQMAADRFRLIDDETRQLFGNLRCFCFFVGHPRSGHTIVRSILDAHPKIVLSDELNALRYVKAGFKRDRLFAAIVAHAQRGARKGSQRGEYTYAVSGTSQGKFTDLQVIGDKNGGRTSRAIAQDPSLLQQMIETVELPVRVIHVVRNPYDNIATAFRKSIFSMQRNIEDYFTRTAINIQVLQQVGKPQGTTVYQEDLLTQPHETIASLCRFLEVDPPDDYLDACADIINPKPNQTRFRLDWQPSQRDEIARRMSGFPHLERYSFDEPQQAAAAVAANEVAEMAS